MKIPPITNSGLDLRDYQGKFKHDVFDAWRNGAVDICGVMPTGAGKTRTSSSIIHEFSAAGMPTMMAAHRSELVGQLSCAMAAEGIYHNIIASKSTVRAVSNMHVAKLGRSFYHPEARAMVSSVDTLIRRDVSSFSDYIRLYMTDECFPAWVEVDGRPIRDINVGDMVSAFNEETGEIERREVLRRFKNKAPDYMVRLVTKSHHVIHCTCGHPIFTQRGWVKAAELTTNDEVLIDVRMYELRGSDRNHDGVAAVSLEKNGAYFLQPHVRDAASGQKPRANAFSAISNTMFHLWGPRAADSCCEKTGSGVLQQGVFNRVPFDAVVRNNVSDKSQIRVRAYDQKEPDVGPRQPEKDVRHAQSDWPQAEAARRERPLGDRRGDEVARNVQRSGVQVANDSPHQGERFGDGMPGPLQSGLWQRETEDSDRSGRRESSLFEPKGAGRAQNGHLEYVGLECVQIHEHGDLAGFGEGVCDGYVYNIEVEGVHTYIANGVVVHNCHHLTRENKWGKCRSLFPNALGLGVTATPDRSDGQGLGRHADGFFDTLVEGPKMRELIRMGFLTDYRIFCPPSDFDVSSVAAGKDGDYNRNQLQAASKKSHIVGDVVEHYKKIAMGKRGVTFCVSVEDAEDIAAQFNAAGVPAMVLTGNNTDAERAEAIKLLESGDILQIVAIDIISEGFDLPAIEAVSFARPTQSYSLFIQMFGRALRLFPGKTHAIIIDHVGNVERFIKRGRGLPDTPQQWSLDRRERGARSVKADDVIDLTTCTNPDCFNVYDPSLPSCPWCGSVPTVGETGRSAPERVPGDLYEMPAELLAQLRGEADSIMRPDYVDRVRMDMLAKHAPTVGVHAAAKRAGMQQEAQRRLRDAMARWTNLWERNGLPVRDVQVMFNQVFGCDVLTAQTLGMREASELCDRVSGALAELGL